MSKFPHLFTILTVLALLAGACSPAQGKPVLVSTSAAKESEKKLDEYLNRLSALGFSGSVLVAHAGEIVFSKGYGVLDRNRTGPITPETIFAIGSNTKPFTAAAILKLQDQGLLKVNDPMSSFFADAPASTAKITIHQLLTHSSGFDHSGVFEGDFEMVSREDAAARILNSELLFPPGEESSYSDYGFILLAAIVEIVSGKSYQEYVRTALLEPAGMTRTGWWGNDPALNGQPTATGYVEDESMGTIADLPGPFWAIMGAGGMVSTAGDLYRWHLALQQGKILSKELLKAYSSVQFRIDERGGEGYGWVIVDELGNRVRDNAGGTPQLGHNNVMRWYMDDDLLFIASSNSNAIAAEDILPDLVRIVFEQPYRLPPKTVPVEPARLAEFVGSYRLSTDNALVVTRKGDKLLVTGEGQQAFDMLFNIDRGVNVQEAQSAVVNFLNAADAGQLEQWKKQVSQRLGEFRQFKVIGTASPDGSGEPWTYVSFEFERGKALTRWIVNPAGALQAAVLDSEPPYMAFLAQSENQFVPFSLSSQPAIQGILFSTDGAGPVRMTISVPAGQIDALKLISTG